MTGPQYPPPWPPTGQYPNPYGRQWPPQVVVVKNSLATAAMVLGIIALLFCWIPFIGVIAWPLGIVGGILGFVGAAKARSGAPGMGAAVSGLITSGLALLVCTVYVVAIGGAAANSATARPSYSPSTFAPYTPPAARPAPAAPVAPAKPAGPATTVTDGSYQVGVDIAAGRYKTPGPDQSDVIPNCYWGRSKDDSGSFSSLSANDNLSGPGTLTIKSGEFVKFSGGCTWTKQG